MFTLFKMLKSIAMVEDPTQTNLRVSLYEWLNLKVLKGFMCFNHCVNKKDVDSSGGMNLQTFLCLINDSATQ